MTAGMKNVQVLHCIIITLRSAQIDPGVG